MLSLRAELLAIRFPNLPLPLEILTPVLLPWREEEVEEGE
jgi:hypothetical protein